MLTWLSNLWSKLPDKVRAYLPKLATWAMLTALGWALHHFFGVTVQEVPVPIYVEKEQPVITAPSPNGDSHTFGWVPPTPQEQAAALAEIKANQNGLDPDFAKLAKAAIDAADADNPVFTWEAETKVLKKLIPVWNQGSIGSCVSHGVGRAAQDTIIVQIANGAAEKWPGHEVAREPIYGGSRVQIGGGQIRGDGSMNSWAVAWLQKYGTIFYQKYDSIDLSDGYSVSRCRSYGNSGCPKALEPVAQQHPIKTAALVKNSNEVWTALGNGYPVCIASGVGFDSPLVGGFCARRGSWPHSMCVRGRFVHPTKGKCFVIQNSWGDYLKGGDNMIQVVGRAEKVQLPPGCFACMSADMDAIAREGDSFALSGFVGFPRQKLDWIVRGEMPLPVRENFRFSGKAEFALAP